VLRYIGEHTAKQYVMTSLDVRRSDPKTGDALPSSAASKVPEDVYPEKFDLKVRRKSVPEGGGGLVVR